MDANMKYHICKAFSIDDIRQLLRELSIDGWRLHTILQDQENYNLKIMIFEKQA